LNTVLSFKEELGDSSPFLARTYLSTSYLTSAALLEQKAYVIEIGSAVQAGLAWWSATTTRPAPAQRSS
jgi:fructose-specific component phosphotransferase system IIB-like protein